ncbi:12357_t:CDS:2 [Funneliformis mosseae]|uniref:12357_t:CDS:1 n=1 Tax=Funneliformis mosseae TaxID=27381 RepID=A0A9N9B386_FUNMO|nr:12357_t:CDS:2 [Funneliformis mosseae]
MPDPTDNILAIVNSLTNKLNEELARLFKYLTDKDTNLATVEKYLVSCPNNNTKLLYLRALSEKSSFGMNMKKKNILSDLVKSFCDLNNFEFPNDPKSLETILQPAEFNAECVNAISKRMDGSEFRLISKFDNIVINVWETLKTYQSLAIDIDRNVKDPSGITIDCQRPDVLVWFKMHWFLKQKRRRTHNIQFFVITKDSNLTSISPRYNISTFSGGIKVLITTLNMFKYFLAAAKLLPEVPFPFLKTFNRKSGASITFVSSDHIQKTIKNFEEYIYSDIETLQEVYEIIGSCEYAVKALSRPEVLEKKRGKRIIQTYVVNITPVCFRQRPKNWEHAGRLNEIPTFIIQSWAPELHNIPTPPYTDKADIYLVGHLLNTVDVLLSENARKFRSFLTKNNPNDRPSAANALHHPWFNEQNY